MASYAKHKFAGTDEEVHNKRPSWESPSTCRAGGDEQKAQDAMVARQAGDMAKQEARSYNRKQIFVQDS